MSFLGLPAELIYEICSHCPSSDIPALRLACRMLSDITSDLLAPKVSMFLHKQSLRKLEDLSKATWPIGSGVRTLRVHLDALEQAENVGDWDMFRRESFGKICEHVYPPDDNGKQLRRTITSDHALLEFHRINNRLSSVLNRHSCDVLNRYYRKHGLVKFGVNDSVEKLPQFNDYQEALELADPYYRRYRKLYDEQFERLNGSEHIRLTVRNLLLCCPNIFHLEFTARHGHGNSLRSTARTDLWRQCLYTPDGPVRQSSAALIQTLLAVEDVSRSIRRLSVEDIDTGCMAEAVCDGLSLAELVSQIEHLDLQFGEKWVAEGLESEEDRDDYEFEYIAEKISDRCFKETISSALALRELRLAWCLPKTWPSDCLPPLGDYIEDADWPHLTQLSLQGFQTTAESLAALLLRHKASLRVLRFQDLHLYEGSWDACWQELAAILPMLDHVELQGKLSNADGQYFDFSDYDRNHDGHKLSQLWTAYLRKGGCLPARPSLCHDTE